MTQRKEVFISGSGLSGLTTAYAFVLQGWKVCLCSPTLQNKDRRTTAILSQSVKYFEKLNLWDELSEFGHPLKTMRILDGTNRLIRAPQTDFQSSEIDLDAFGYNFRNQDFASVLTNKLVKMENFEHLPCNVHKVDKLQDDAFRITISSGEKDTSVVESQILIGADGKNSIVRQCLLPETKSWQYPQTALVVDFEHEIQSGFVSTEIHTEHGPFTVVPQTPNQAGLVWMNTPETIEKLLSEDPASLESIIESQMQSYLGKIKLVSKPASFPITGMIAKTFGVGNLAIVGDAAHTFPPIGAQGFNLGTRDIQTLADIYSRFADTEDRGRLYDQQRRIDVETRTRGVDLLNKSLLSDFLPMQMIRTAGLQILKNVNPIRKTAMRLGISPLYANNG